MNRRTSASRCYRSLALAGLLLVSLATAADPAVVRVGLLLPPEEAEAASVRQGVELAVDQANQSEAPPVELFTRGRMGQWGDDGVEAARMVLDDRVQGLLAPPDGAATHLTLQVAGRTATPVVSLCSDSSVTAAGIPWSVRMVPSTTDEAFALFTGLRSLQGARSWLAFVPEGRAGREVVDDLLAAAHSSGTELVRTITVAKTTTDFSTFYPSLPPEWPDGMLLWLDPEPAGHLIKYLRTIGFRGVVAGPGRLESGTFQDAAGSALEGLILPKIIVDCAMDRAVAAFQEAYRDRHGRSPDAIAAMAYDAAGMLIHLLREAGDNPSHGLFPLEQAASGVTGPMKFDPDGNRVVSLRLHAYHRGDLVPLQP
jgi:branched-chain amino acid transport system substrate-binding protein